MMQRKKKIYMKLKYVMDKKKNKDDKLKNVYMLNDRK